jgi:hypothetical protein
VRDCLTRPIQHHHACVLPLRSRSLSDQFLRERIIVIVEPAAHRTIIKGIAGACKSLKDVDRNG